MEKVKSILSGELLFVLAVILFFTSQPKVLHGQVKVARVLEYDNYGNPVKVEDALGHITKYYYGSNSNPFSQLGHNGIQGVYLTGIQKVKGTDDCPTNCGTRPGSGDDLFTEARYDEFGRLSKIIDENAEEQEFGYDEFNRLVKTENPQGGITRNSYFYSTSVDSTYNPDEPNLVENISGTGGEDIDFSSSSGWSTLGDITFNVTYAGEKTVRMGTDGGYDYIYKTPGETDIHMKVDFYANSGTGGTPHIALNSNGSSNRFAVLYRPTTDKFEIQYRIDPGDFVYPFTFPLNAISDEWYTVELEKNGSELFAWVYPKGETRDPNNFYSVGGFSESWEPWIQFYSNDDYYYLSNLEYTFKPIFQTTFIDGLGRQIQTQQRGGGETIISSTLYNDRGLPEVVSRPFMMPNGTDYVSNNDVFGSTFVAGTPLSSGELKSEYNGLSGGATFPYSYTQYEASPLAHTVKSRIPGGSSYDTRVSYGLNSDTREQFTIDGYTWGVNKLQKTVTTDPTNKRSISYVDGWGRTIASGVDVDGDSLLNGQNKNSCSNNCDLITEFKYDLNGNLVRVEDPMGFITTYAYNSLGQLIKKKLPDQDQPNRYKYDRSGNLRFIQTPNHSNTDSSSITLVNSTWTSDKTYTTNIPANGLISYGVIKLTGNTIYFSVKDPQGMILKELTLTNSSQQSGVNLVRNGAFKLISDQSGSGFYMLGVSAWFRPFTFNYNEYDEFNRVIESGEVYSQFFKDADPNQNTVGTRYATVKYLYDEQNKHPDARKVQGRLAEVQYRDMDGRNEWGYTWYSYNELGLVEWIIQRLPGQTASNERKIVYSYDELGRITRVFYDSYTNNPETFDDHYFWYYYDGLGRLEKITSNRNIDPDGAYTEAEYEYFADGQIKELKLGGVAQDIDYTYTVQGWLDKINNGNANPGVTGDRFGLDLSYANNGNISQQTWSQSNVNGATPATYSYSYDPANRLSYACFGASCNSQQYDVSLGYDNNGNIKRIQRFNNNGNKSEANFYGAGKDYYGDLEFANSLNRNRLGSAFDWTLSKGFSFSYDANGNMTYNPVQGMTSASYDWRNLPKIISSSEGTLYYAYDAEGNRVKKQLSGGDTMWYVRGADGQVVAVYNGNTLQYINIPGGIGRIEK